MKMGWYPGQTGAQAPIDNREDKRRVEATHSECNSAERPLDLRPSLEKSAPPTKKELGNEKSKLLPNLAPYHHKTGNPLIINRPQQPQENCSVLLNNMFSELLRLQKEESGHGPAPRLSSNAPPHDPPCGAEYGRINTVSRGP